ncbi:type II secretion system protein [Grimontia hollisae]|uniref:type II secretion system protein n=1 Tax=Grimontia hollisae TaxID=673 RepID=UPI0013030226|nr:type II secretion system protein [Grimontia hollisae]
MKRQGGFTLIEMIVVIVILGILAVTAAPKFLSFEDEAREATLKGLKGAMDSAASLVYAQASIKGAANTGVVMTDKYPAASAEGIGKAITISDEDFIVHTGNPADDVIKYTHKANGGTMCAMYKMATGDESPVSWVGACTESTPQA